MKENITKENLVYQTFDVLPNVKEDAFSITSVKKKGSSITHYKLSNNQVVTKDEAIEMAKNGMIENVGIAHNKDNYYLKSLPDGDPSNDLSRLPEF